MVLYGLIRSFLLAPTNTPKSTTLRDLPEKEKIKALAELEVIYTKRMPKKIRPMKHTQAPSRFYPGSKEDFETMEKVRFIDERGNPVYLEEEGQNGTDEKLP